jgi:hypothetical protein
LGLQYDKNAEFLKGLDLLQIVDFTGNNLENLHQNLFLSQANSLSSKTGHSKRLHIA